ncbi:MAG: HIT family protein [Pseudomonadota bacterium]
MSLETTYDPENIFAKIIRGDMPCVKLWEDDEILAFMDVFPQSKGHCLVVPKSAQATNLFDIDRASLETMIVAVQRTARALKDALAPDGVRIAQFNGAPAGQSVFHIHFHIIPAYEGAPLARHGESGPANAEDLEPIAAAIRAKLS